MNDEATRPLPFYFRKIEAIEKYIVTNLCGSHVFLDSKEQVEQIISGRLQKLPEDLTEELIAKSFVASEGEYESRLSLVGSKYASLLKSGVIPPGLFMVNPTLRCDHDCQYCQVSRVPVSKKGFDLPMESIRKIIKIIEAIPNDAIKIEFQGGEPLLAFEYIQRFVEAAERALIDRNVSYVICTALGPITEEIIEWARGYDVVFSTSLDGPELLHDENRPSRYFPPYKNTVKGIQNIRDLLGQERLGCLTTITKHSLCSPEDVVEEHFKIGLESIFLRPLSPFGFATQLWRKLGYSADEFFSFYKKALGKVIEVNASRVFVEELALIHLRKIFRAGTSGYADLKSPSGYLMGALVFNYDGNVFGSDESRMLWESTKAPELVLGSIDDNAEALLTNENAIELLSDTIISTTPGCDECAYQPYCGADPLYHLATQGDHVGDKAKSFFCQLERLLFDHLFSLYETSKSARRVFDKWLSL